MRNSKVGLIACCAAAVSALTAGSGIPVEPGAALFQNDDVRVVRALEKAHVKGNFHEHKPNRVMVYLQAGKQKFEYQDGRKAQVFDWKPGQIVWSPAEGMHSPEVISDEPFNIVEVELKKAGSGKTAPVPQDSVKLDAAHHTVELDNDQVRVVRVKLGAHQSTPIIEHPRNAVLIFLTDQETKTTDAAGKMENSKHKAGEAVWATPGTMKMENVGNAPLEMIVVEIKS